MAVLFFCKCAGPALDRLIARYPHARGLLLAALALLAWDLCRVGGSVETFFFKAPALQWNEPFAHYKIWRPHYINVEGRYAKNTRELLSIMSNEGVLACHATHAQPMNAQPADAPGYRGLVYLNAGGKADITRWTPNEVEAVWFNASPGERLVYNMNFDRGWRSNGGPVEPYNGLVSVPVSAPAGVITLRYRPASWPIAVTVFLITAGAAMVFLKRGRTAGNDPAIFSA